MLGGGVLQYVYLPVFIFSPTTAPLTMNDFRTSDNFGRIHTSIRGHQFNLYSTMIKHTAGELPCVRTALFYFNSLPSAYLEVTTLFSRI